MDIHTITDTIRTSVSALEAGKALGLLVDRHGRCACPVHRGVNHNCRLDKGERGFHCFKCGASGDVIHLVQAVNGCSFWQAVEWLNSAFHLGLPLDRPLDKNAAEAARRAKERRQTEREQRMAIERMEFDLYVLVGKWLADLESDKEQYRPRRANEEWDERFVQAVRLMPEVKELAERIGMEVIGNGKPWQNSFNRNGL